MSLEGLVKDIEEARKKEQERWMAMMREQYEAIIRAKDEEIAALRDEIETLRSWLDHSALPAMNPISKRPDSTGLIKLNFGKDKPPPEMWRPGEKDLLDSVKRKGPGEITDEELEEAESMEARPAEVPRTSIPEPPRPERTGPHQTGETRPTGPESSAPTLPKEIPEKEPLKAARETIRRVTRNRTKKRSRPGKAK
jgi:hypothetical protein